MMYTPGDVQYLQRKLAGRLIIAVERVLNLGTSELSMHSVGNDQPAGAAEQYGA